MRASKSRIISNSHYYQANGSLIPIIYLPVDEFGMVRIEDFQAAITPQTILVTIMHSNNEVIITLPSYHLYLHCYNRLELFSQLQKYQK